MRTGFALSGAIGAGKSTTVKHIIQHYNEQGLTCEVVGFAKPLKELAVKILGRPINKATDRAFLQHLGMGFRSPILEELGAECLFAYLLNALPPDHPANASDSAEKSMWIHLRDFVYGRKWGYSNFWIDLFNENLPNVQSDILLVEDMRFLNEYEYLCEQLNFISVRVEVDPELRKQRVIARDGVFDPTADLDASEKEWRYIPYVKLLRTDAPHGNKENLDQFFREIEI